MASKPIDKQLSDEQVLAIGALVVVMSRIDSLLTDLIAGFLKCNIFAAITIVHHQQTSSKIDSLRALMHAAFGDDPEFADMFTPLSEAKRLSDERNTIVHCLWSIDDTGESHAVRFTARGKFKRTRVPYNAAKIRELVSEAAELEQHLARMRSFFPAPLAEFLDENEAS